MSSGVSLLSCRKKNIFYCVTHRPNHRRLIVLTALSGLRRLHGSPAETSGQIPSDVPAESHSDQCPLHMESFVLTTGGGGMLAEANVSPAEHVQCLFTCMNNNNNHIMCWCCRASPRSESRAQGRKMLMAFPPLTSHHLLPLLAGARGLVNRSHGYSGGKTNRFVVCRSAVSGHTPHSLKIRRYRPPLNRKSRQTDLQIKSLRR